MNCPDFKKMKIIHQQSLENKYPTSYETSMLVRY